MNIFLGYEDFVDIFWGSSQNWTSLRVFSMMHFRVFFKVKLQNWDIFLSCYNFKYFVLVLEIPGIILGWTVDTGPEPKKLEYPPPPTPWALSPHRAGLPCFVVWLLLPAPIKLYAVFLSRCVIWSRPGSILTRPDDLDVCFQWFSRK